jgi:hypothetical protein
MDRARRTCGEKRNAYRVLMDNIKIDLKEMGWDGMIWTGLIYLRIGTSG